MEIAAIFPVTIEAAPKAIPINDNITVIVHAHRLPLHKP